MTKKRRNYREDLGRPVIADPLVMRTRASIERSRRWQALTPEQWIDVCAGLHFEALCESIEGPSAKATSEAALAEHRGLIADLERTT